MYRDNNDLAPYVNIPDQHNSWNIRLTCFDKLLGSEFCVGKEITRDRRKLGAWGFNRIVAEKLVYLSSDSFLFLTSMTTPKGLQKQFFKFKNVSGG